MEKPHKDLLCHSNAANSTVTFTSLNKLVPPSLNLFLFPIITNKTILQKVMGIKVLLR